MSTLRFVLLLNLLFIISCKKDYYVIEERKSQSEFFSEMSEEGEPTILGAQLPNPYLVENMLDAKKSLDIKGVESINEFNISTSHIYVKFEPQNSDELTELYLDDRLILFDIPLDYEIITLGNWYREPNLDDNKPTPQYAVIPVDIIPSISYQYELLAELYIPEKTLT